MTASPSLFRNVPSVTREQRYPVLRKPEAMPLMVM